MAMLDPPTHLPKTLLVLHKDFAATSAAVATAAVFWSGFSLVRPLVKNAELLEELISYLGLSVLHS